MTSVSSTRKEFLSLREQERDEAEQMHNVEKTKKDDQGAVFLGTWATHS